MLLPLGITGLELPPEGRTVEVLVGQCQQGVQGVQVLNKADDVASERPQRLVVAVT